MYDQMPSQSMPIHPMSTSPQSVTGYPVDPNQFYQQQMMLSHYDRQMVLKNSRPYQPQRANMLPSRVRGSTRSYSRSYDSYRDEISEDDDFIDNRELDEITDSGYDRLIDLIFSSTALLY